MGNRVAQQRGSAAPPQRKFYDPSAHEQAISLTQALVRLKLKFGDDAQLFVGKPSKRVRSALRYYRVKFVQEEDSDEWLIA